MQYSDKPISKPSQDVLGRAPFALRLAKAIDNLSAAKDGFVMAVLGGWGSGKSSVIELTIRYLRHLEMERASTSPSFDNRDAQDCTVAGLEAMSEVYETVSDQVAVLDNLNLNLNYWQRAQRIDDFRRWLDSEADAQLADHYWRLKYIIDNSPRTIVVRFSPWLIAARTEIARALFSELARSLGEKLGDEVRQAFAALLQRLSELAPFAGAAVDLATGFGVGKLVSAGGSWAGKIGAAQSAGPTLDEIRTKLKSILSGLEGRQILIVIDDLDRLTPPEALEMVSLIKSLGDLPNVIYLLGYDDAILSKLIHKALRIDGRDFLEKIVQYSAHIPALENGDLTRLLDVDLSALLGNLTEQESRRIGQTWYYVFRHYFRTPRHVRRYINSLNVSMSALRGHVDPIDHILLEVLRLHEPEVYGWLRQNIDEMTT